jgi:hypothetical protein
MALRAAKCVAAVSALVLLGTAAAARAETPGATVTVANANNLGILTIDPGRWGAAEPVHKSLQWDQKGRWGLKLDMVQPVGREMQLRDVQAGAYYRVTPSLRVGGAVALSDQPVQPDHTTLPSAQAPQVKLETTFKF